MSEAPSSAVRPLAASRFGVRLKQLAAEAFLSDQTRKAAEARRTADEKRAKLAKAQARLDRMTLIAPIIGIITASAITTIGQVVTSGQEVMRIVPAGGDTCAAQTASANPKEPTPPNDCGVAIDVQAYVTNDDIGFVTPGQPAVIKIDSFPYTRFGTIAGTVLSVASDAISADQANSGLADPTRASDPASHSLTPTARPMTDLVFETRIKPALKALNISGKQIDLIPGMTVTVEIRTGSRKIIDYLFSPLVETFGTAMRER